MLKIPFIEHTGIGLEITSDVVRWVEATRLGRRWSMESWGELSHNNSEASILTSLEEVLQQVNSDAFHVALVLPEVLLEVLIEEVPFSEEPDETEQWVTQRKKELLEEPGSENVIIQHHMIQVDEDSKRCVFQLVEEAKLVRVHRLLEQVGLYPEYTTAGLIESGYSQLFNPEFVEGNSSLLQQVGYDFYLTVFETGLLKNVYKVEHSRESETEQIVQQAHSYLQTEEATNDSSLNSISLYADLEDVQGSSKARPIERAYNNLVPFTGKKGFDKLSADYSACAGGVVRLNFDGLDSFNFSPKETKEKGILDHNKEETIRLCVLLFAPLILFALIAFGVNRLVDYQLIESNQVMEQIGDNIDQVGERRTQLLETQDRFLEARTILQQKKSTAYVFEQIAELIPAQMWLSELSIDNTGAEFLQVRTSGYATTEGSITAFLGKLEASESVNQVSLILSETVEANSRSNIQPELTGTTLFELLIGFNK